MLRTLRAGSAEAEALLDRTTRMAEGVDAAVAQILADVRARGDAAVADYTRRFDRREPVDGSYELSAAQWDARAAEVAPAVRAALELAAGRLRAFHALQHEPDLDVDHGGVRLTLRVTPLGRVGLYVPGGTARYPSSVLMTAIPAVVAGVPEVVMVTPGASAEALLAARIAGVDRVFELGGAQAVAALAYGTETVPRVDKIVGPGNAWVASAKRQVYGEVDIDSIAGPSEVLIIADGDADPAWVAADLIAQAEHDAVARAIVVTTAPALAAAVAAELVRQLGDLPRREIAERALAAHGAAVIVESIDGAIAFANRFAPEHLELQCADARAVAARCTTRAADGRGRALRVAARGARLPQADAADRVHGGGRRGARRGDRDARGVRGARRPWPLGAVARAARVSGPGELGPLAGRVPEALRGAAAYHVPVPPRLVAKLDANELPYALPEVLRRALGDALAEVALERYPDPAARRLRSVVARQLGVAGDQVVFGNGSDELIAMLCAAFAAPRGALPAAVLYPVPSFVYYQIAARNRGLAAIEVPLTARFELDEDAVIAAIDAHRPSVVFLALPNNPTGTLWRMGFALELAARYPDVVVVSDEAYHAYSGETLLPALAAHANLVVMRTLSKLGMAGLRVGFTISSPAIAGLLEKVRPPYNLSALDQRAAELLLDRASAWCAERAAEVVVERARLAEGLAARGLEVFPSAANLLLVRTAGATALWQKLAAAGISVRRFDAGALAGCLRITVGTAAETDALLAAL
jgi:histidinol dehydrogenase